MEQITEWIQGNYWHGLYTIRKAWYNMTIETKFSYDDELYPLDYDESTNRFVKGKPFLVDEILVCYDGCDTEVTYVDMFGNEYEEFTVSDTLEEMNVLMAQLNIELAQEEE